MNLHVLEGPNFSGRTDHMREWVGLPTSSSGDAAYQGNAYIGPDASDGFTGIAPTVAAEIEFMAADSAAAIKAKQAIEALGFDYCLSQNPFTLSGGEQVVAAIVAAAAARPKRLGIDCALEQLSPPTRTAVLAYLKELDGDLMIADNRLDEWYAGASKVFGNPRSVTETSAPILAAETRPHEIELVDLCHAYVKGRPVLKNLNVTFKIGQQYLLKGANGVGKTTLARILCGLVKPTSGEIRIDGKPVQPWRNPGRYVGYSFQNADFQLFANSVAGQLGDPLASDPFVQWFELERVLPKHPLDIPYAHRKRVALATAFIRKTGFLILDEPTVSQDKRSARSCRDLLNTRTGVVISHSQLYRDLTEIILLRH